MAARRCGMQHVMVAHPGLVMIGSCVDRGVVHVRRPLGAGPAT